MTTTNPNVVAFERMCEHLLRQKRQSTNPSSLTCMYRGKDGLKCAVGALIPDDGYLPEMEGISVSNLLSRARAVLDTGHFWDNCSSPLPGVRDEEDQLTDDDRSRIKRMLAALENVDEDMLCTVQAIHDNPEVGPLLEAWEAGMRRAARKFARLGLSEDIVDRVKARIAQETQDDCRPCDVE